MNQNNNELLTLNQEISKLIKESEKLNDKIISKEKQIKTNITELNILKQEVIKYDEQLNTLLKKRVRETKKILGN